MIRSYRYLLLLLLVFLLASCTLHSPEVTPDVTLEATSSLVVGAIDTLPEQLSNGDDDVSEAADLPHSANIPDPTNTPTAKPAVSPTLNVILTPTIQPIEDDPDVEATLVKHQTSTPTDTITPTPTQTPTQTDTPTLTPSPTLTLTPTATLTPTLTSTVTETATVTATATRNAPYFYTVQEGDYLATIAEKENLGPDGVALILLLNPYTEEGVDGSIDPTTQIVYPGQQILLPNPGLPLPTSTPIPADLQRGTKLTYIVQAGDTLAGIASLFNSTMDDIIAENNLDDPNAIFVGQQLTIPVNQVTATATFPPTSTAAAETPSATATP